MDKTEESVSSPSVVEPIRFSLNDGRVATLRACREADAEAFCQFLPKTHAETDFLNYFPGEFNKTVEEERDFLRNKIIQDNAVGVVVEVDGEMVACGGAWSQEQRRFAHHAELGLGVLKAFWRQGIGRKLMDTILEWGRRRGLHKIYLKVHSDNDRAIQLYESLGFVEEGRLKNDIIRHDGGYRDTIIMAKYYDEC